MGHQAYVYIITNKSHTVLYTGVTSDLIKRIYQHKHRLLKGFSSRHFVERLVYFEVHDRIGEAIKREKQIKGRSRQYKIDLVNKGNWLWQDLYDTIL